MFYELLRAAGLDPGRDMLAGLDAGREAVEIPFSILVNPFLIFSHLFSNIGSGQKGLKIR